ncbi:MAG: magnesium transporter [Candidatus Peregrinibacteria bacterium Gr01-1014_25]|nr:MAG: magnesium transporter [Candidatus Peregrinibacteria bacterium Gr01-1014_25]
MLVKHIHPHLHALSPEEMRALPADAAARRMIQAVPIVDPHVPIGDVRREMEAHMHMWESVHYVYIVDEWGKLVGVLSIRDVYRLPAGKAVGEVCKREGLVSVHPRDHQERAAYAALKHNIKAVPVVDHDRHFLGVLPSDVILHILYKEMHEDVLRRVGVTHHAALRDDVFHLTVWQSFRHRTPWLLAGLGGGLLVAKLIGVFEAVLQQHLILAAFIPLIVYMSDAVGTQMEAFVIRDLAIDRSLKFWRYFLRQLSVVVLIAASFSVLLALTTGLLYGAPALGMTLGLALAAAIFSSLCTGVVIPYLFSRLRMDPANASGPIATIIQDFLSVLIYFLIAQALL